MKFRKIRNEQIWEAENGITISYSYVCHKYVIYKCSHPISVSEYADTLNKAKEIANTDLRFK